jgi:hypothetical protein
VSGLLVAVALLEAALLALAAGALVGRAVVGRRRERRLEPRLRHTRVAAAASLNRPGLDDAVVAEVAALPRALQIRLVSELARQVDGAQRRRLAGLADALGLVALAEGWCRRRRWWLRLRGARLLSALDTGNGAVVLALFADPRAEVRAQAAEWAAQQPGDGPIGHLLELLDDPRPVCRFAVKDALLRHGFAAEEPIARYLARSEPRPHEALEVAAGIAGPRFLPAGMRYAGAEDPAVRARAAVLLGGIGGAEAVARLTALLGDDEADVRAAAATALGRLAHWPAAGALSERLADPAWAVRRAAGLALRDIGAPGLLLLRRSLTMPDRFGRDMARQILDLPDTPATAR